LLSTIEINNLETVNAARFFDRNCHHAFAVPSLDNQWCFAYTTVRLVAGVNWQPLRIGHQLSAVETITKSIGRKIWRSAGPSAPPGH
jgi:hypothetical protein